MGWGAAHILDMRNLLGGWLVTGKCRNGGHRVQMHDLIALSLELLQKLGHRGGRRGMDIVEQDDAAATLGERGHHPVDYTRSVPAAPVE
jgi:hypothetical protein